MIFHIAVVEFRELDGLENRPALMSGPGQDQGTAVCSTTGTLHENNPGLIPGLSPYLDPTPGLSSEPDPSRDPHMNEYATGKKS